MDYSNVATVNLVVNAKIVCGSNTVVHIVSDTAHSGQVDVSITTTGGTQTFTTALAGISQWQIDGCAGNDQLVVDFSQGDPLPAGGLLFNGGSVTNGDSLHIVGTSSDHNVTVAGTQVNMDALPAIGYSNVNLFGFNLGTGNNSLTIAGGTVQIENDGGISAGTALTVASGTLVVPCPCALPSGENLIVGSGGSFKAAPASAPAGGTAEPSLANSPQPAPSTTLQPALGRTGLQPVSWGPKAAPGAALAGGARIYQSQALQSAPSAAACDAVLQASAPGYSWKDAACVWGLEELLLKNRTSGQGDLPAPSVQDWLPALSR